MKDTIYNLEQKRDKLTNQIDEMKRDLVKKKEKEEENFRNKVKKLLKECIPGGHAQDHYLEIDEGVQDMLQALSLCFESYEIQDVISRTKEQATYEKTAAQEYLDGIDDFVLQVEILIDDRKRIE